LYENSGDSIDFISPQQIVDTDQYLVKSTNNNQQRITITSINDSNNLSVFESINNSRKPSSSDANTVSLQSTVTSFESGNTHCSPIFQNSNQTTSPQMVNSSTASMLDTSNGH